MITTTTKNIFLPIFLVMALVSPLITKPAAAALAPQCALDQHMWINGGGDGFGGVRTPGQTFRPSFPGKVCKIEVMIHKNIPNAGDLNVMLRRHNLAPIPGGAVAIPGNLIPMGFSIQTIDFGAGPYPELIGSPFYGLTLSAPGSPPTAYTWVNSDDAGADGAYPPGTGYYNSGGGWEATGYDYAFKIYLLRP